MKERHEYKFLISRDLAWLLRQQLPRLLQRDSHAGKDGSYTIRSLYFDDLAFSAFHDKLSGVDDRTKFRIRCYNYSDSLYRLEKKEKKGELSRKTGQILTPAQVWAFEEDPCEVPLEETDGLAKELRQLCLGKGVRPVALVDYDRTSFVCSAGNTRITLDENLRTLPYCRHIGASPGGMIPVTEPDQVILEVKFDEFLPGYLGAYFRDLPKIPVSFSKFAMCLQFI